MSQRRAVITGMGAITCLGLNITEFWDGLVAGRSGIRRITQFDPSPFPCQIAGEIEGFNPEEYIERKEGRRIPRSAQIALGACHAGRLKILVWFTPSLIPNVWGLFLEQQSADWTALDEALQTLAQRWLGRVNPFAIPSGIPQPVFLRCRTPIPVPGAKFERSRLPAQPALRLSVRRLS